MTNALTLNIASQIKDAVFFREDWSRNNFYGHSLPSADSRRVLAKESALSTGKLPRRLVKEQCGYVN